MKKEDSYYLYEKYKIIHKNSKLLKVLEFLLYKKNSFFISYGGNEILFEINNEHVVIGVDGKDYYLILNSNKEYSGGELVWDSLSLDEVLNKIRSRYF